MTENARDKPQCQPSALPPEQLNELCPQLRLDRQQFGEQWCQEEAREKDQDSLHDEDQPAGLDQAAVSSLAPIIFMIDQQTSHRAGHAQVDQTQVAANT